MAAADERPLRPAVPLVAASLVALGAVVYRHFLPQLRDAFATFYMYEPFDAAGIQRWRQPYLFDRMDQYALFLPEVALAALIFAAAVRWHKPLDAAATGIAGEMTRVSALLLLIVVVGIDVWFSTREWQRYGQPCWDGYCKYGSALAGVLRGRASAGATLTAFMRADYHCNSPVGPLLWALTSIVTRLSMINSYRLVCGLASVGALAIFVRRLARARSPEIRLLQILLLATNTAVARSFAFPQTDALILLWSTAIFATALTFAHRPTMALRLGLLALGISGVFVKLSFLPLLLVAPLCRGANYLLDERPTRSRLKHAAAIAVGEGLLLAVVPLAAFFCFQLLAGTTGQYRRELEMARTLDFHPLFIAEALFQVTLPALVLVWLGRRSFDRDELLLLCWLPLFFLALTLGRASGWERFYLAIMPALALLARPGLERLGRQARSLPWLFVALSAGLSYLALAQRIIH